MEKWELAFKDYQNGMKYKDIAAKHNVSINTVKSWKSRKWNNQSEDGAPLKKVAHKNKKGCTQKETQPVIENDDLTEQQKMFCLFYLQHFNATKAYQQAYQVTYQTANAHGYKLLSNVVIKEELRRLKSELQQETFVTTKDLIREYIKQAFADISDVVTSERSQYKATDGQGKPLKDAEGNQIYHYYNTVTAKDSDEFDGTVVKEITQGRDGVSVKLYDKQKALSELMKYFDNAEVGSNTEDDGFLKVLEAEGEELWPEE